MSTLSSKKSNPKGKEPRFVGFRLSEQDVNALDRLAARDERSRSAMLRRLIRKAMAEA